MLEQAIIIGAGPAGLTAALELLDRTKIHPIILEKDDQVGGLSKTVNYKGNRIDIGGHRFFSKSDRVMDWWAKILPSPLEQGDSALDRLLVPEPGREHEMLVRQRVSRIYFLRQFFDYPIKLSAEMLLKLGPIRSARIGLSYAKTSVLPKREERSLEDFMINRFGGELYRTFFRDYTEKVWGVPCDQIKPEWGAQRIKGLSITRALVHAAKGLLPRSQSVRQKEVETSLIERFLYPKLGPGQLWEETASRITKRGGEILLHHEVASIRREGDRVVEVIARDRRTGELRPLRADYVISSMPISELVLSLDGAVPENVSEVARGLIYRDFITVGVLARKLKIRNTTSIPTRRDLVPDNWLYIQEPDVRVGRLQIFNNWSPYMVSDQDTAWLGMEYFCNEGDDLWSMPDDELKAFGARELEKIGVLDRADVLDSTVLRVEKAYPAYFGAYERFDEIRQFLDPIRNLYPVGRNGMHRYNNSDHSMLTAMTAVDHIVSGITSKDEIWQVNTEQEYHETKKAPGRA